MSKIPKKYRKASKETGLTTSTKTVGRRVTRNSEEEIYYSAVLNEVTGENHLTGGECPEYDIDGDDFFVTNDGREFKVCPKCFAYIMINNSCMGAKVKRCRLGVQLEL